MIVQNQSYQILTDISPFAIYELQAIELAARTCYKSEDKIVEQAESAKQLIKNLIDNGHEAMLEHSNLMVKFICDRGVANEIVRHRLCSFAQESTRYCNYSRAKFKNQISVIQPCYLEPGTDAYRVWYRACENAEIAYFDLLGEGLSPQEARAVLPTSLKTELVVTANYREWRHIFRLRTAKDAHPQIRALMTPLLHELQDAIPVIFDDIQA